MAGRIRITAAVALFAAALAGNDAGAAELKLAHFMSPQHPMDVHVMRPLAEAIGEATGGEVTVKVYPAGELGKGPNQQYKRAVTGVADIAFNLPQYTADQFKRTVLLHVPGIFDSPSQATAAVYDDIDQILPDYDRVKLLAFWTNNPAVMFTRETPVRTFEDLKGMKVRAPDPVSAEILEAWGAVPVSMPVTEAYNAMSTGVVDAVMVGPSAIGSYKLHEVSKYVTLNTPGALSTFTLIMNREAWDGLSDAHKAAIEGLTGRELGLKAAAAFEAAGQSGLDIAREGGVEFITLDDGEVQKFVDAMTPTLDAYLAEQGEAIGFDAVAMIEGLRATE